MMGRMVGVLMTNPGSSAPRASRRRPEASAPAKNPGLELAIIGNPKGKRMPAKKKPRARRSPAKRPATTQKKRKNPNADFWRVGKQIPWKKHRPASATPAAAPKRRRRKTNPNADFWRVGQHIPWKKYRPSGSKTYRTGPRRRRNPPAASGVMGDLTGVGGALASIGKQPMGALHAVGGAAITAVGGTLVSGLIGRSLPAVSPGVARFLGAGIHLGTAVAASRLWKDPTRRRLALAGGLAVSLLELARPGSLARIVARIPGVNRLVAAPAPVPVRPMAGLGQDDEGAAGLGADDPVAVDGIADTDGRVQSLIEEGQAGVGYAPEDPTTAPVEGTGELVETMGALVQTYDMAGLGACNHTGRGNALTQVVTP